MHTHYFGADVAWCSTNQLENLIIVPSITTTKQWINKTQHTVCFETFGIFIVTIETGTKYSFGSAKIKLCFRPFSNCRNQ